MKKRDIVLIVVSIILIGILMPYGLNVPTPSNDYNDVIIQSGCQNNGTCFIDDYSDSKYIIFRLAIILPIVCIVGLLGYYLPPKEIEDDLNG